MTEKPQSCALYRHFDEDGVLLYVGVSSHPERRTGEHIDYSRWVEFAAYGSVEWCSNLSIALVRERRAIQTERPVFNRVGATGNPTERIERYLAAHCATLDRASDCPVPASPTTPVIVTPPDGPVSLRDAVLFGVVQVTHKAMKVARERKAPGFPEPVAKTGQTWLYDQDELRTWQASRTEVMN